MGCGTRPIWIQEYGIAVHDAGLRVRHLALGLQIPHGRTNEEVTVDRVSIGCQPASMPQRERYLFVCINRRDEGHAKGSCTARGSEEVYRALKEQLNACGLAKVGARVCTSSCLDQCSSGVCVLVEPDHFFYGRVTVADVPEIVAGMVSGARVERLVLTPEDLAKG